MIVKIDMTKPAGVTFEELATFIHDALSSWGGQFHPDDPLFFSLRDQMKTITIHGKVFKCEDIP